MAEKKQEKKVENGPVFKLGVNLKQGKSEVRYEAGDKVPDLTADQRKALKEGGAI